MTGELVSYLTTEDREERETWAAELAGSEETWILERDFGGHVYQEKLHWFLMQGFRPLCLENRCEVLVDSERDVNAND